MDILVEIFSWLDDISRCYPKLHKMMPTIVSIIVCLVINILIAALEVLLQ